VLGLGAFALLLPVARLDFDRHHDGYRLVAENERLRVYEAVG
jgi:hypothetical protein